LNSHPLMDDHLFFSWLEKTPWREAIRQRLTGNWVLDFPQLQMYRPVSGLWQVAMYQIFGANPLPNHLTSLFLHLGVSFLAGILAYQLSANKKAGWVVSASMMAHPRVALSVSLIFNFYDLLVADLMLGSLVWLHWARRDQEFRSVALRVTPIWLCTGLALGSKEVALPIAFVLLLADSAWRSDSKNEKSDSPMRGRRFMLCHSGTLVLTAIYLFARAYFIGHPFRTHNPERAFPLPANSLAWAFFWDGLVLSFCLGGAVLIKGWPKLKQRLPKESSWMLLWCGSMLLPPIHFCSQVTLRPWFFDERYWYVPLVSLNVFAGSLLTYGTLLSSALGGAIMMMTLPGRVGLFLGLGICSVAVMLSNSRAGAKLQRAMGALALAALTLQLWRQCSSIRLRADEAENLHSELREVIAEVSKAPIAFLEFTESNVEKRQPFNGDLQWLLGPPFLKENIADRVFFAYPTWDSPPTNRFRDRTTIGLLERPNGVSSAKVYRWNGRTSRLEPVYARTPLYSSGSKASDYQSLAMKRVGGVGDVDPISENNEEVWDSGDVSHDPRVFRYVGLSFSAPKRSELNGPLIIKFQWVSSQSADWSTAKEIEARLDEHDVAGTEAESKLGLWLFPGRCVDWLLGGSITRLKVLANSPLELNPLQLAPALPTRVLREGHHVNVYAFPIMNFQWMAEFWWNRDH
jgi:hypothetical protein